jgi:hypothetical protein
MDTRKFIELSVEGEAAAATDYLNDLLAAKAFEALETRKQELSRTIFGGRTESTDEVVPEDYESEEYEE